ncbi:hypothetical protein BKP45_09770 [Anaerobacillus alkalidiazotrophicus]|uniref:HTH marR-type domain-containing protein n=1 Tax=Anaerobacillus alkalidiazotrophicus TaxID=472963 RepID=A0A1S2M6H9_9BACI|nr:MarR family transcriptional regulator [Anaerobacillus alkalidiazotrophicus]OIJ20338.1 hypothetical protein BKP45_09770 [Anaerobacillus alkalidiazotrophicus]
MKTTKNLHSILNLLRGTSKVVEEDWQKVAHLAGLTQAEQHTLWIIYFEERASITKIANYGLWDRSTVMQVVKRLKEKGLVTIEKDEKDLRVTYVILTEEGRKRQLATTKEDYSLFNYLNQLRIENEEAFNQFIKILVKINQQYHGEEYVQWVEKTAKIYEDQF